MEKLFWGMVGLCTIAFAFLLGMYLNQSGVLNFSAAEETTTVASEEHPEDYSEEIQSLIEASQGNYATAMRVLEETSEENEQQIADNLTLLPLMAMQMAVQTAMKIVIQTRAVMRIRTAILAVRQTKEQAAVTILEQTVKLTPDATTIIGFS